MMTKVKIEMVFEFPYDDEPKGVCQQNAWLTLHDLIAHRHEGVMREMVKQKDLEGEDIRLSQASIEAYRQDIRMLEKALKAEFGYRSSILNEGE